MSTQTPRREGPGRPRDPNADTAILRAAAELLIERGIDNTSIEAIARRAGVAKVTVYKRWKTKEDLLAQAIEQARADIPAVPPTTATTALPDLIEALLPQWGKALADPKYRLLSARLLGAGPSHPALLNAYWNHHVLPRRERSRILLQQAQDAGILSATADLDILLDMLDGAIIHHLLMEPAGSDATDGPQPTQLTAYLRRLLRQTGFALPATNHSNPEK
ncbi:TetR/AcrR family transcriptional regulator [Nocardia wallacei]|uniref:TetR/AcrR family transcriptional regulator n=1 Tax=Nocardia wallacei TaxID=480035 RepID=UPI002457261B|nr:TetR/AcrR family transcriptional regulator [Nocardia wallacei]